MLKLSFLYLKNLKKIIDIYLKNTPSRRCVYLECAEFAILLARVILICRVKVYKRNERKVW